MVCCDFVNNEKAGYGIGFIKWFGDNVLHLEYNEEDKCYVGVYNGRNTVAFFNHIKFQERLEKEIKYKDYSGKDCIRIDRTILNKIDKKYEKYIGYDCVEISCFTNHDMDYYDWSIFYKGVIEENRDLSGCDTDKLNKYAHEFESMMSKADINYNNETFSYRKWNPCDVDDCHDAYNYLITHKNH